MLTNELSFNEKKKENFINKVRELDIAIQKETKKIPVELKYQLIHHIDKNKCHQKVHIVIYTKEKDFKNMFFDYSLEYGRDGSTYKAMCLVPVTVIKKFYSGNLDNVYSRYFSTCHIKNAKIISDKFLVPDEGYCIGVIAGDDRGNFYDIQVFPSETVTTDDKNSEDTARRCINEEFGINDIDDVMSIVDVVYDVSSETSCVLFELK